MNTVRILKNVSSVAVNTNSYGKIFTIAPKSSLTINDSQADQIATELLYRYGFLKDITPKAPIFVEKKEVIELNAKGRPVRKEKKVVRKGRGVTNKI